MRQHAKAVAISGASGLIGRALVDELRAAGHRVHRLVRREARADDEIGWRPSAGELAAEALRGVDAVINLAGENIAGGRWTVDRKRAIRASRVDSTTLLADTFAGLTDGPRTLVNASAIGFYGDRGDERLDESSAPGVGFLAETSLAWEGATASAEQAGVRVVKPRIGVVLAREGGALAKMLPLFRLGLGGRLGNGRQYMSWIALPDVVAVLRAGVEREELAGPVNAVAPGAVTNAEFTRELGHVLGRPTLFPAPAAALKLVMGQMADELLLASTRVVPAVLQRVGFRFACPDLRAALESLLQG